MEKWTVDDFKKFVINKIKSDFYITPSMIVLKSFYVGSVEKPKDITVKMFDWLRSIAEKEMKIYKSQL